LLLLDSQAALWVLDDNPRLGPNARRLIATAAAVHVSAATVWELTIKAMLGKLSIPEGFAALLAGQGLVLLSITAAHADGISQFPELTKHDPFDRILMSQASHDGLLLITADRVLLGLDQDFVVDATQ
jgi:PIN domain nuclease of toxin-antitoxin system